MSETNDLGNSIEQRRGLIFVFMAGVLWSTVGLGIRMIDEATVWQILLYRSISLSLFLALVIYLRSRGNLFKVVKAAGLPGCIAGLALVGAPLPLISYGGTSLLTVLIGVGLVLSINIHENNIVNY